MRLLEFSDNKDNIDLNAGATGKVNYYDGSSGTASTTTFSTGTWNHFACVKSSGTVKVYLNGTSIITQTSVSNSSNRTLYIGGYTNVWFNGWIDEVRVSNTARYTANFTPSTTPFQNDANTVLLLHMDGTNASTVFFDDNGIAPYTP